MIIRRDDEAHSPPRGSARAQRVTARDHPAMRALALINDRLQELERTHREIAVRVEGDLRHVIDGKLYRAGIGMRGDDEVAFELMLVAVPGDVDPGPDAVFNQAAVERNL